MSHVDKLPAEARTQALMQIGARIAESSPERTIEWLKGLDDPQSRRQLAQHVVGRMAQRDDELAVRLLERVPEDMRTAWIQGIGNAYINAGDFERSSQWVKRFQDEPIYAGLVASLVTRSASSDVDAMFDLISKIPDDRRRDRLIGQSLSNLAMQAPEVAVKHVDRIANDAARNGAVSTIASAWARRDYAEAKKWALSLDASKGRDEAIGQIAANQRTSMDEALSLVGQMRTPERRSQAIFSRALAVARSNPEEARTLMRRYPLDPGRQRQVERALEAGANGESEYWNYWAGDQ